jgi:hypothetical protein
MSTRVVCSVAWAGGVVKLERKSGWRASFLLSVFVRDSLLPPLGRSQERFEQNHAPTVSRRSSSPPLIRGSGSRGAHAADGRGRTGCEACRRWIAAGAIDGGCWCAGERESNPAATDRRADAEAGMGGVHRCHADARAARLGAPRRRRGVVDDPAAGSIARGVVRRCVVAVRRIRAGGDRFGAGRVARRGRAPNEARPGIGRRSHHRR